MSIFRSFRFYQIVVFNLIPLIVFILLDLSLFYFLYYFVFETIVYLLLTTIKVYAITTQFENSGSIFSNLIGAILFTGLKIAVIAIPLGFLLAIAGGFHPTGSFKFETAYEPLFEQPLFFSLVLIKAIFYHVHWVRSKKFRGVGLMRMFYMMIIKGFGGVLLLLILYLMIDDVSIGKELVIALLFTVIMIAFELWDEYDKKTWLFGKSIINR